MQGHETPALEPVRLGDPVEAGEQPGSVYVHAPFCARRCFYCDFAVSVARTGEPEVWADALTRDLDRVEAEGFFRPAETLDTLFVGGGTPSLLGPGAMQALARVLGSGRVGGANLEWTAEANPESFSQDVAAAWAEAGVNRLSFGTQSLQPAALTWLRRLHGSEETRRAVGSARAAGIDNISLDLIFGLPSSVDRAWGRDLEAVLDLEVPHVSLYGLTVEVGTPLHRAVENGSVPVPDETEYGRQFLEASRVLTERGFVHYEVSNFARPGHESRHNLVYWDRRSYTGLGNSAHSLRHPRRRWNLRDWTAYQEACVGGTNPWVEEEVVDAGQARLERIWLALRTNRGLWVPDLSPPANDVADRWVEKGWARIEDQRLTLTPEGWLLLDSLAVELDDAQESSDPRFAPRVDARSRPRRSF